MDKNNRPLMGFAGKFIRFTKYKVLGQDEGGEDILGPGVDVLTDPFSNMLLDQGLDYLGSQTWDNLAAIHLGTGNTAPTGAETSISGYVAGSSTDGLGGGRGLSGDGTYLYRRISKRFAAGSAAGVNLASVAVGHRVANGEIFSLALLKDTGGSPTTITLTAEEVLDVVYELRMYLPAQDLSVAATVDGTSTTVTIRRNTSAAAISVWASTVGVGFPLSTYQVYNMSQTGYENLPSASSLWDTYQSTVNKATLSLLTYVPGSYQYKVVLNFAVPDANFATGLGALTIGNSGIESGTFYRLAYGFWAYGFSPKLNKTSSRTAAVTVGLSWGRYTP